MINRTTTATFIIPLIVAIALLVTLRPLLAVETRELRPRAQPSIPEGWTEDPFEETSPEPIFTQTEQQRGYMLFQRPITEPVHPNTRPQDHERFASITAFATPGEFEPLTFSLYPNRDLKNLTVRCSDLISEAGRIPATQIGTRLLTYWNIGFPRYTSRETYRRLPELLERVTVHSSPARECQRWWLTVHVPKEAKPGLYTGMITVQDDGFGELVTIPVRFRVLGFRLKQDPRKHLSAYYYPRNRTMFLGRDDDFIDRATANEYQSMIDHGLDMLPTFYLQYDRSKKKIIVQADSEIDRMLAAGLKGPLPVLGGNAIQRILQEVSPNVKRGSHWAIEEMQPPEFYENVTETFRQLKKESADRGWPEIVCCPLDEVVASSSEFGIGVYKAVRDAGIRTYATKNPIAMDATGYRPFVNIWCSQPFAMPYEKVIADSKHEYWSYPNHNAGERKNRRVMCKGGRMTYGFGFWRSGYTTLIPWHWAWTMAPDPFDYLRTDHSGAGQRIDDDGRVIPAVYWECFREGYDDARYIYSLQQAAWERAGSTNPDCQSAVSQARTILQQAWMAIDPQERYLADNIWPSSEFNARRWLIATQIERLHKFPVHRQGVAPSVYLDDARRIPTPTISIVQQADEQGILEALDLGAGFSRWKSETPESSIEVLSESRPNPTLQWNVHVDHQSGGSSDGQYHVGWPRIRRVFGKQELDMSSYDFLEIVVRVDSDRDEVQDDTTILGVSLSSHSIRRLVETSRDLGDQQREDIRIQFSIPEMIRLADKGVDPWKSLAHLQLFVAEANYPHGSSLHFNIKSVRLLRFKTPMVSRMDVPRVITLPQTSLPIPFAIMGTSSIKKGSHDLFVRLVDSSGQVHSQRSMDLYQNRLVVLDTSRLRPGKYRLDAAITTKDRQPVHRVSKVTTAMSGP